MAEKPQQLIQVEIFGQTYSVRGGEDPRYLEELAAYVDKQMREISRAGTAVDTLKIAILAALNIADERFQLQSKVESGDEAARRWAEKIATELASALGE